MIVSTKTREKRFAYLIDEMVEKIHFQQPQNKSMVGNIYLGQVTKVIPGMNAAFVEIGEEKGAYLQKEKMASFVIDDMPIEEKKKKSVSSFIKQGERVLVQVVKDATGTKGPKISGIIELSGENLVYMPFGRYIAVSKKVDPVMQKKFRQMGQVMKSDEEGIIFRTSAVNGTEADLYAELEELRRDFSDLKKKSVQKKVILLRENDEFEKELNKALELMDTGEIIFDLLDDKQKWQNKYPHLEFSLYQGKEDIFSAYHIENEVEKALKRIVWLKNGAYLLFDAAEGATIIDVNTGKFEGKQQLEQTVFQTNMLAAKEVARQVRLRNLSGMILIDFIDMKEEEQRKIKEVMSKELKKDNRQTKVMGFTSLGILEITRKKAVNSLSEMVHCKCPTCEGTGLVKSAESVAFKLERELWEYRNQDIEKIDISATSEVVKIFCGPDQQHKIQLEEILGFTIQFIEIEYPKPYYHIKYVGMVH